MVAPRQVRPHIAFRAKRRSHDRACVRITLKLCAVDKWLRSEFVSTDIFDISLLRRLAGADSVLSDEEKDLPSYCRGFQFSGVFGLCVITV